MPPFKSESYTLSVQEGKLDNLKDVQLSGSIMGYQIEPQDNDLLFYSADLKRWIPTMGNPIISLQSQLEGEVAAITTRLATLEANAASVQTRLNNLEADQHAHNEGEFGEGGEGEGGGGIVGSLP